LLTLPWFRDDARAATVALIAWALLCLVMIPTLPAGAVRLLGVMAALCALDAAERAWSRRRRAWRAYGFSAAFTVTAFLLHQSGSRGPAAVALVPVALLVTLHVVVASWVRAALSSSVRGRRS
jgi:hypothetical protein